jgi:hypothetical protein
VLVQIPLMIAAVLKYFAGQTLMLDGVKVASADAVKTLQAYADALKAANAAHAQWADLVVTARKLEPGATALVTQIEAYVRAVYGNANAILAEFGLSVRKRATRTVAAKVEQVERALATRVARHTAGPKEKAKIHGTVPTAQAPEVKPKA